MQKRLYRSRTNRQISGVCGGLAEYFEIDPTIVRIIMFILVFFTGFGILPYIFLWIIIPEEPEFDDEVLGEYSKRKRAIIEE